MNQPMETPQNPPINPFPKRENVILAISNVIRWKMLKELSQGEARSVTELSKIGGCTYARGVKHLQLMRDTGVVVQGRGRLYQLPKQFLPQPGHAVVDFGHCVLRLDLGE